MNKYNEVMMRTAYVWADESYCKRRKVGAVIAKEGHILDTGYNGTISGANNTCEDVTYKCDYCDNEKASFEELVNISGKTHSPKHFGYVHIAYCRKCKKPLSTSLESGGAEDIHYTKNLVTNDFTIHAEQNIIANCAKEGISLKGATMYITTSPCKMCAKLIASSGIKEVYYAEEYKDLSGVDYLNHIGIKSKLYKVKS